MSDGTHPDDLTRLEQALARRALPEPPAGLRLRALGEVRRARARERNLLLAAAAAVVLAVGGLWASRPPSVGRAELRRRQSELAQVEEQLLGRLGYEPAEALRVTYVLRAAGVPRLAPPMGSGAAPAGATGGL